MRFHVSSRAHPKRVRINSDKVITDAYNEFNYCNTPPVTASNSLVGKCQIETHQNQELRVLTLMTLFIRCYRNLRGFLKSVTVGSGNEHGTHSTPCRHGHWQWQSVPDHLSSASPFQIVTPCTVLFPFPCPNLAIFFTFIW